jgi:hypothetical protein
MLTKDDLEQIGKLLDSRLQAEPEHTKKPVEASEARLAAKNRLGSRDNRYCTKRYYKALWQAGRKSKKHRR